MTHVLVRGTKSETVSTLKYWLNLVVTPNPSLSAGRDFDQPTFDAVVKFQIVQGLHPDGKVGADTWGRLGREVGKRDLPLEFIASLPLFLKRLVTGKPQVQGAMAFDPSIFLGMFMKEFGVLNQNQVEGLEQLLAFIELDPDVTDIRWAAYMMATVKWECADTWQPIEEGGKGAGHPYGVRVKVKDGAGKEYTNTYYGRGYVQLT